ncbi:MAG: ATP-binding protein [Desulfobacteraceae bacterium]|nr:ATP-binding protein [Desulfobacteraceae bacterium]
MELIPRQIDKNEIQNRINAFPVTAILGPRQCGKTTMARSIKHDHYFDLENPRDMVRFENPQLALEDLTGLIVIDEIQRYPDLFPLLRYLVDSNPDQKYLILGSASQELIRQSSESLAGRIAYFPLSGLRLQDVGEKDIKSLWIRGGFPDAFTPKAEEQSRLWRENFITTFLERDIPQLGISIPANTLRRFWTMLSHYHGQVINYAELGRSFGISDVTVRKYIDILEGTFMVRVLQPWYSNTGKRLVKRPKIYLKDSGIFHTLLNIENHDQLLSHPKLGASYEGFALECICRALQKQNNEYYFYRVHSGSELDLFWQQKGNNWGIEFKYADAPRKTRSMTTVAKDLNLRHLWVIYPGKETYRLSEKITVTGLSDAVLNGLPPTHGIRGY